MTKPKKGQKRRHEPNEVDGDVAVMEAPPPAAPPVDAAAALAALRSEEELREMDEIADIERSNVRFDSMTKEQLATYALRTFGVHIDTTDLKVDVTERVRDLMRIRGR